MIKLASKDLFNSLSVMYRKIKLFGLPPVVKLIVTSGKISFYTTAHFYMCIEVNSESDVDAVIDIELSNDILLLEDVNEAVTLTVYPNYLAVENETVYVQFMITDGVQSSFNDVVNDNFEQMFEESSMRLFDTLNKIQSIDKISKLLSKSITYSIFEKKAQAIFDTTYIEFKVDTELEMLFNILEVRFLCYLLSRYTGILKVYKSSKSIKLNINSLSLYFSISPVRKIDVQKYVNKAQSIETVNPTAIATRVVKAAKVLTNSYCTVTVWDDRNLSILCKSDLKESRLGKVGKTGIYKFNLSIDVLSVILNLFRTGETIVYRGVNTTCFKDKTVTAVFTTL